MPFSKTFAPGEILTAADVNDHLLNGGYQFRETEYFTSSGTFVKADYPWLRAIRVRVQGAGGGGGGARSDTSAENMSSAGGSSGGYSESFITDVAGLDASVTITRGAGGAGGVAASAGSAGGASSFGTAVTANGGLGGNPGVSTTDTLAFALTEGGTAGTGDLALPGQDSIFALTIGANEGVGGAGANAFLGKGGSPTIAPGNSSAAVGFGGGGGGARDRNAANRIGGDGADGLVIVELYG